MRNSGNSSHFRATSYFGSEDKCRKYLSSVQWLCNETGLTDITKLVIQDLREYSNEISKEAALSEFMETLDDLERMLGGLPARASS